MLYKAKAEAIRNMSKKANKKSLRQFTEAISKFQGLLKKSMQSSIVKAVFTKMRKTRKWKGPPPSPRNITFSKFPV